MARTAGRLVPTRPYEYTFNPYCQYKSSLKPAHEETARKHTSSANPVTKIIGTHPANLRSWTEKIQKKVNILHPEKNEHIVSNSSSPAWQDRTRVLLGDDAMQALSRARVCVIGLGAVGGYAVEGLARAGVGGLRLVDFDVIRESNINRQVFALRSTLGRLKAEVAAERVLDINPDAKVETCVDFASAGSMAALLSGVDVLVDAVDSLTPKVDIIQAGALAGVPVYSALGAATRLDAGAVAFGPLFSAKGCPLGRLVRKRLRRRGIADGDLWCVFSDEDRNLSAVREPEDNPEEAEYSRGRARKVLGSLPGITGLFGLRLAHEVVLRLASAP